MNSFCSRTIPLAKAGKKNFKEDDIEKGPNQNQREFNRKLKTEKLKDRFYVFAANN